MAAKTLYQFKGPDHESIVLTQLDQMYYVQRKKRERFVNKSIDSFSFGRLSHAITKYWDMVGEFIEKEYAKHQEGGN